MVYKPKQPLEDKKNKIQELGLDKIQKYFDLTLDDLKQIDPHILKNLFNMARLGMTFEKEMNLNKRSSEMNFLRVGRLVTENKKELKKYIKKTLPNYQ